MLKVLATLLLIYLLYRERKAALQNSYERGCYDTEKLLKELKSGNH